MKPKLQTQPAKTMNIEHMLLLDSALRVAIWEMWNPGGIWRVHKLKWNYSWVLTIPALCFITQAPNIWRLLVWCPSWISLSWRMAWSPSLLEPNITKQKCMLQDPEAG